MVKNIPAGNGPDGIAVDGNTVWVSNSRRRRWSPGSTATHQPSSGEPIAVGTNPDEVRPKNGVVWVANTDDGTVSRIEEGEPRELPSARDPRASQLGDGFLWVANGDGDSVSRIDL